MKAVKSKFRKVKSKFRKVNYKYITINTEGLQVVSNDGLIVVVPIDLSAPNALYKIQDVEKAINLYEKEYKGYTLALDKMIEAKGLNHMFSVDNRGKIVYAKSSLHSTFGRFNRSLFPNIGEKEIIFTVREDKSVIAVINAHYTLLFKDSKLQEDISGIVSNNSYRLFKLLCTELTKAKDVREILTKVV